MGIMIKLIYFKINILHKLGYHFQCLVGYLVTDPQIHTMKVGNISYPS